MKKLFLCILFIGLLLTSYSQKVYFVYLQSEADQPFFVKVGNKIHSSTSSGYLILSKLVDSTYNFSVGFPQSKWPEQNFSVTINKKDHGFLLKQFGDKGWGLYNLQTLSAQMSSNPSANTNTPEKGENKDVSKFTEVLSKVADDPSIMEKPVKKEVVEKNAEVIAIKEEKKVEPVDVKEKTELKPVKPDVVIEKAVTSNEEKKPAVVIEKPQPAKTEPVIVKKEVEEVKPVAVVEKPTTLDKKEAKEEDIVIVDSKNSGPNNESYLPSKVKRWSESSTTEGFGLVFIDDYNNGVQDTIRLLIPNPKQIEVPVSNNKEPKEEMRFIDIENKDEKNKEETKLAEVKPVVEKVTSSNQSSSNNCTEIADESDFLKLRKQMAAKESDDAMINEAKNYFKTKCFTSEQIKNLSALFLNDENKYKFFDESYNHVFDADKFSALQSEIKDQYYINRFRAMLRN
ncbi:MAG: DUF4476 domain-containing protein [Chitinophagaceae bacterium]